MHRRPVLRKFHPCHPPGGPPIDNGIAMPPVVTPALLVVDDTPAALGAAAFKAAP